MGYIFGRGIITTLCYDAIVNAANSGMTGCYVIYWEKEFEYRSERITYYWQEYLKKLLE